MPSTERLRDPGRHFRLIASAIFGTLLILSSSAPALSQQREGETPSLAACPTVEGVLNITLPAKIAREGLTPRSGTQPDNDIFQHRVGTALADFQAAKAKRRQKFIALYYPEAGDVPAGADFALDPDEKERRYQPFLQRFRQAHGSLQDELDLVRRASNRFWARDYQPTGAAPRHDPSRARAEALATELAIRAIQTLGKAPEGQGDCRIIREALIEAATWSLSGLARERLRRSPRAGIDPHLGAIGLSERLLGLEGGHCATTQHCVLAARIAVLHFERHRGSASAEAYRERAGARIDEALRLSGLHGPVPATAEAWMVKAELEPVRDATGPILNPRYVDNAFAARQALTQLQAAQAPSLETRLPNQFRHRLLPIFQAAADSTYRRVKAGQAPATDLIAVGEASRRAQIESVFGDACEPLEIPFAPRQLQVSETIVYPVVGTQRTYILVGTNRPNAPPERDAHGWTLVLSNPKNDAAESNLESDAAEMADRADRLVTRLDLAALEFGNDNIEIGEDPIDWGGFDARWLHKRLVGPLVRENLIRNVTLAGNADAPTLIFFPDPAFRNLPWALLHSIDSDERKERDYLVRSAAIAVAPALAYVRPLPQPHRRGGLLAGAIADSDLDLFVAQLRDFGLANRLSGSLKPKDFTRANLLARLSTGGPSVLLLATHATFDGPVSRIAVSAPSGAGVTPSGQVGVDEIELSIRQARRRTTGLDLLILISCEGAVGDAGQLGLAGAALRGGAASTIGPIVRVAAEYAPYYFAHEAMSPSPGTGESAPAVDDAGGRDAAFLTEYYRGRSPAQALRQAQLASLGPAANAQRFEANWGVFLVVGNWR